MCEHERRSCQQSEMVRSGKGGNEVVGFGKTYANVVQLHGDRCDLDVFSSVLAVEKRMCRAQARARVVRWYKRR